jgi:hypothetical protein
LKTIIINNAGPRGPVGPQGETGASGSDANVPPLIISSSKQFTDITSPFTGSFTGSFKGDISVSTTTITATTGSFSVLKGNSPITVQDSVTFQQPVTGSVFSGSFAGDGSNLINVPASGVVGLNLSQISSGTATASISETGGLFVNTHITASGDISASSGTITALTGSFNHIITDDETLEFRSKSAGTKIGQLKFNSVNGLEIQNQLGARAKVRAARGEFLSLEAGPVGMNSLGSITASNDISASGKFIGDGSGLTNVFENTAVSSSLSSRITTSETNITNLQTDSGSFSTRVSANEIIVAKTLISGSAQIASSISGSFVAPSASFSTRVTVNETNISDNRSLITGITSSLNTTGRMVFVGASGILTSEAGFEYNATTNQLSVDNLNVNHLTSSFITSSQIFTSGSNIFGDASNDVQTLIGTTKISGSAQVTGSLNTLGVITGDGAGLTNIPASGIVGLNLSQIASGSISASIAPNEGFKVNSNITASGNISVIGGDVSIGNNQEFKIPGYNTRLTNNYLQLYGGAYISGRNSANSSFVTVDTSTGGNSFGFARLGVKGTGVGVSGRVFAAQDSDGSYLLQIKNDHTFHISGSVTVTSNVSSSIASTASFGTYLGDGSNLSGISTTPFPFSGSAIITGSLIVSQSIVDFSNASSVVLPAATQPLINPEVRYFTTTVMTGSGTTVPIPGGLTFISSSIYEYMEIFINGLRLRYDIDFIPMSTASVQYTFALPVGSEITYKSLKRP